MNISRLMCSTFLLQRPLFRWADGDTIALGFSREEQEKIILPNPNGYRYTQAKLQGTTPVLLDVTCGSIPAIYIGTDGSGAPYVSMYLYGTESSKTIYIDKDNRMFLSKYGEIPDVLDSLLKYHLHFLTTKR